MQNAPMEKAKDNVKEAAREAKQMTRREMREMKRDADEFLWSPLMGMQQQMARLMEQNLRTFSSMTHLWQGGMTLDKMLPKVRVWENEKEFHLETRLPADNPDCMEITMHDGFMTLKWDDEEDGEMPLDMMMPGANGFGAFHAHNSSQRTVMIPENADAAKAHAVCKDGMLEVIVPKKKGAESKGRSVPIDHA
ncbi:MAG: Hsp20/alpha crystallin family protein [Alphaproteobacteria bacterium]|nr:Hsp20/alpha crystallin family protein [Alphaproteobacteria bacterium]MCD8570486.1 Hsp20/alpha crystallin family protein [Alphaproteobacteria bacterium]